MKYRKRPLFRITSACLLVLLAGLALAPEFQAFAKNGLALASGKEHVDTTPPQITPHRDALPHSKHSPLPNTEAQDEAAPVAQPENTDEQPGFDEDTSFAIGEPAMDPSFAAQAAAPLFAASMGSGGSGGSSGHGKDKQKPKSAAANPAKPPAADGETDARASHDPENTDGHHDDNTGSGDNPNNLPVASVPEPSSILLLAVGLFGLALARRFYS